MPGITFTLTSAITLAILSTAYANTDTVTFTPSSPWFSAVAAYSEVIHLHAKAASAYAARGTAHLYGGNHEEAVDDYTTAIEIAPDNPSYWRRRAHAWSTATPPDPQSAIDDATQAIELDPTHHMGYGHRAVG